MISTPHRVQRKVECDICGTERVFREKNQAKQFYQEHETCVGHILRGPEQVVLPQISALDTADIAAVVDLCFEAADTVDAVPTGIILEASEDAGVGQKRPAKELERAVV